MKGKRLWAVLTGCVWVLGGVVGSLAAEGAESAKPAALRLYALKAGEKRYFTGYDWMLFDLSRKIALVEKARRGAVLQMNVVMALPAERYVRELDRMYAEAAEARTIEVGQAIQGIAITLKDWDEGSRSPKTSGTKP